MAFQPSELFPELPVHTFTAHRVMLDDSLTESAFLGEFEVDDWMDEMYGRAATVQVQRDDGKTIIYTDDGQRFVPIHKFTADV
ncbi:hypothetical protein [Roseovarius sp. MMSF_3281]|uniref:hypothetical protein n=1 Tax=Roseovarius sp. MMSF_3281 TaxID=3046694 RepID=UPI00273E0886|nr:hypothetical protein [Roseovarius sp. MMSF_3281]